MPKPDYENKYNTRSKGGYIPFKNVGNKFRNSFFPHMQREVRMGIPFLQKLEWEGLI